MGPSKITNYQNMRNTTDFDRFKNDSVIEDADSLSGCMKFCFDICCHLETINFSSAKVSSPHLNRCLNQHLNHIDGEITREIRRLSSLLTTMLQ